MSAPDTLQNPLPIALSAISFHQALFSGRMNQQQLLAQAAALGFTNVELLDLLAVPLPFGCWTGLARRAWHTVKASLPFPPQNPRPLRPKKYLPLVGTLLRAEADKLGLRVVSWTLDTDLALSGAALAAAESYWEIGIATARALGASVLRITSGGALDDALLPPMRANLQRLVERAGGLQVAVENHGGLSSDPVLLEALIEGVAGCCLDLGNYPPPLREAAVRRLAPYTVHVHAKTYAFDSAGNETTVAYPLFIDMLREAGYQGYYSIEYEGYGDPATGICRSRDLLTHLLRTASPVQ